MPGTDCMAGEMIAFHHFRRAASEKNWECIQPVDLPSYPLDFVMRRIANMLMPSVAGQEGDPLIRSEPHPPGNRCRGEASMCGRFSLTLMVMRCGRHCGFGETADWQPLQRLPKPVRVVMDMKRAMCAGGAGV